MQHIKYFENWKKLRVTLEGQTIPKQKAVAVPIFIAIIYANIAMGITYIKA